MKKKTLFLPGLLAVAVLALGGCGASSAASHHSASQAASSSSRTSSQSARSQSTTLWNKDKDQQLSRFIQQWGPTMGQSYTKYDGQTDLKTKSGMSYPSDFDQTTVNGTSSSIGWAPSGKGDYDYNVVALYNYNQADGPAVHITYAFAFHNGQPVALVDQSTNGTPNWTPTKNTDVSGSFAKIANGQGSAAAKAKTSNAKTSAVSDR